MKSGNENNNATGKIPEHYQFNAENIKVDYVQSHD